MGQTTVEQLRQHVKESLLQLVGRLEAPESMEWFSFVHGTTRVAVTIGTLPATGGPAIGIWALTNLELTPEPELFETVAQTDAPFGAPRVILMEDGTASIKFNYTLPYVERFDSDQFQLAVELVAKAADEFDDYIQARFGGRIANDPLG